MEMLRRGVDRSVIALWLGHESMETTQIYLHADMQLKEQALARAAPLGLAPGRYQPDDSQLPARLPQKPVIMPTRLKPKSSAPPVCRTKGSSTRHDPERGIISADNKRSKSLTGPGS